MNKEQLINLIVTSKTINKTLNKVTPSFRDDFRQFIFLQVLELTEEKLLSEYLRCDTCLYKYVGGIIRNQLISDKSPFYLQYRKDNSTPEALNHYYNTTHPDTEDIITAHKQEQLNVDNILNFLRSVHPKKTTLFKEYYLKGKTIKEISAKYNIKYTTVRSIIKTTEALIKEKVTYKEL